MVGIDGDNEWWWERGRGDEMNKSDVQVDGRSGVTWFAQQLDLCVSELSTRSTLTLALAM